MDGREERKKPPAKQERKQEQEMISRPHLGRMFEEQPGEEFKHVFKAIKEDKSISQLEFLQRLNSIIDGVIKSPLSEQIKKKLLTDMIESEKHAMDILLKARRYDDIKIAYHIIDQRKLTTTSDDLKNWEPIARTPHEFRQKLQKMVVPVPPLYSPLNHPKNINEDIAELYTFIMGFLDYDVKGNKRDKARWDKTLSEIAKNNRYFADKLYGAYESYDNMVKPTRKPR